MNKLQPLRFIGSHGDRVRWSIRWPTRREPDPELAAGGYRTGIAESMEEAEKQSEKALKEGPRSSA